jgi:hypothetical protein
VPLDDALHDGKTNAGTLEVLCPMQSLENAEKLRGVTHVEADPVIPHPVYALTILKRITDAHQGVVPLLTVLNTVADQIDQHLAQEYRVTITVRNIAHLHMNVLIAL